MKRGTDGKSPGFWLFTADLERDFQILSLEAQGLAIRMLCWMHNNEAHRGFLELPTGHPMNEQDIAAKIGKPLIRVHRAVEELDRYGVFSRDGRGCIYSRRMARETHISEVRRQAASRRLEASKRAANGTFAGDFAPPKHPPNGEQKPEVTVSVSDTDSDTDSSVIAHQQNGAPAKGEQNGMVIRSTPEWKTDPSFAEFVSLYRDTGGALIDEDFLEAHKFTWKTLDFEQKAARVNALREKLESGYFNNPAMVPRPKKFLEQEWKRPIAPKQKSKAEQRSEQRREEWASL